MELNRVETDRREGKTRRYRQLKVEPLADTVCRNGSGRIYGPVTIRTIYDLSPDYLTKNTSYLAWCNIPNNKSTVKAMRSVLQLALG